jgi:hypothetical protein
MLIIMVPAIAVGIVSLVCWIMTLIPIFKENVGLGILGIICGLFAFIYGWVKVKEYNNKKVMIVWSIAMVAGLLLQVVSMVASVVLAQAGSAG